MSAEITLSIDYKYFRHMSERACFDISHMSHEHKAFIRPIERISGSSVAERLAFRPTPEAEIIAIMKNRKEVAERIASEMTEFLLNQMAKKDTLDETITNGE